MFRKVFNLQIIRLYDGADVFCSEGCPHIRTKDFKVWCGLFNENCYVDEGDPRPRPVMPCDDCVRFTPPEDGCL